MIDLPKISISIQPAPLDAVLHPQFEEESRKLIALHKAAPALLAIVKQVCAASVIGDAAITLNIDLAMAKAINNAIAKAEGR